MLCNKLPPHPIDYNNSMSFSQSQVGEVALCQAVSWLVLAPEYGVEFGSVLFIFSFFFHKQLSWHFLLMVYHQSVRRQARLPKHIGSLCLCHVILGTFHWPKQIAWSNSTLVLQEKYTPSILEKTTKLHGKGHRCIILIQRQHEESWGMLQSTILY